MLITLLEGLEWDGDTDNGWHFTGIIGNEHDEMTALDRSCTHRQWRCTNAVRLHIDKRPYLGQDAYRNGKRTRGHANRHLRRRPGARFASQ
jgi:hypothetical protein